MEIEKNRETQEQYWAREVVWATGKILSEGQPFNWKHIRNSTNMRRKDFEKCLSYTDEFSSGELAERIKLL